MRALSLFGKRFGDADASAAAERASSVFLHRQLYKRRSDDSIIREEFVKLHYPLYWHYDFLAGLKALAETGFIGDPGCNAALDLLEEMELPDGGWPATAKYYKASSEIKLGNDHVDWGGTGKRRMNEWITADALYVLKAAGRISV